MKISVMITKILLSNKLIKDLHRLRNGKNLDTIKYSSSRRYATSFTINSIGDGKLALNNRRTNLLIVNAIVIILCYEMKSNSLFWDRKCLSHYIRDNMIIFLFQE